MYQVTDYDEPLKQGIKQSRYFLGNIIEENTLYNLYVKVNQNSLKLQDNVFTNPFNDDAGSNVHEYLTLEQITQDSKATSKRVFLKIFISLSEERTIRARSVYDFITLVSEVSGFADLLIVFSTFSMTLLVAPSAYESSIVSHLGQIALVPKKRMVSKTAEDLKDHIDK